MRKQHIFFGLFLFFAHASAFALNFEKTELEVPCYGTEDKLSGSFQFTNETDRTIRIVNVHASCGCTAATPSDPELEPGESGSIDIDFSIGYREGPQNKRITVQTDEPENNVYTLFFKTNIPELVKLTPRFIHWDARSPIEPKLVSIRLDEGVEFVEARSPEDKFTIQMAEGKKPGELILTVEPVQKTIEQRSYDRIPLRFKIGQKVFEKTLTVHLRPLMPADSGS